MGYNPGDFNGISGGYNPLTKWGELSHLRFVGWTTKYCQIWPLLIYPDRYVNRVDFTIANRQIGHNERMGCESNSSPWWGQSRNKIPVLDGFKCENSYFQYGYSSINRSTYWLLTGISGHNWRTLQVHPFLIGDRCWYPKVFGTCSSISSLVQWPFQEPKVKLPTTKKRPM